MQKYKYKKQGFVVVKFSIWVQRRDQIEISQEALVIRLQFLYLLAGRFNQCQIFPNKIWEGGAPYVKYSNIKDKWCSLRMKWLGSGGKPQKLEKRAGFKFELWRVQISIQGYANIFPVFTSSSPPVNILVAIFKLWNCFSHFFVFCHFFHGLRSKI